MQYIKDDIEKMLREHPRNEAKLMEIQLKKEEYQEQLYYAGTVYEDTDKEIIENMQLSGQGYDNIHSNTNKITDKVLNTAMNYQKEQIHINKEDRQYLERKIQECEEEEKRFDKKIVRVKNLLNQLTREQKFIIKSYYLEKSKWDYVSNQYFVEYQKPKSINQLLNIRDTAINSMLDILNTGI